MVEIEKLVTRLKWEVEFLDNAFPGIVQQALDTASTDIRLSEDELSTLDSAFTNSPSSMQAFLDELIPLVSQSEIPFVTTIANEVKYIAGQLKELVQHDVDFAKVSQAWLAPRRGEALGLRWQDFDGESIVVASQLKLENGKVVRGDLKTERSKRSLRLPDFLIEDLEIHRQRQRDFFEKLGKPAPGLIFPSSSGTAIRPDNLRKRFIAALKLAEIEPHEDGRSWTVHELRHTAASQLLNDRMPVQIVSRALGHSSVRVTIDVYSHLSDKDTELLADSMNGRYGSKTAVK